ncbi:SPFH domain-containing protein [Paraburkholderia sp.]|uniref:SPFH domain-containing protein n=1 Tax=Paraburkholderia sp. TaxID=1926495 RepID=UPI0039E3686B
MKRMLLGLIAALTLCAGLSGCGGVINTGEVGVRTTMGDVSPQEEGQGVYLAIFSHVDHYTVKETSIDLNDLTPRAKDKLTVKDLEVSVYYRAVPGMVAKFAMTHAGQSGAFEGESFWRPGYHLVANLAKAAIYDQVPKFDSLDLNQKRAELEADIVQATQAALDADPSVKGTFVITRVVVRKIQTDPAIDNAIQQTVLAQQQLAQKENQAQVARKDAEIAKIRAEGQANANDQLQKTLTPAFLQHEYNQALQSCASNDHCTMVIGQSGNTLLNVK